MRPETTEQGRNHGNLAQPSRRLRGIAAALPAAAQDKLVIGTEAAYKPFAWVLPSGELTGFDIDITNALCKQMGAECEISNQSLRRPDPGAERQEDRRDHRLDVHHRRTG